jgi:hypothetical protein
MPHSNTILVPLNRGYFTAIDKIDRDLVTCKLQAAISKTSTKTYATKPMMTARGRRQIRLHRLIMERMLGRTLLPAEHVDHIDGDGLNNHRSNLRLCTKATNAVNSKRRSDNQSGYKGVCFHPFSGLWRAYITVDGKQHSLGYYKTPQEGHEAYKVAAVKFYGEFARFE